jgi:hypothetical protein
MRETNVAMDIDAVERAIDGLAIVVLLGGDCR